MKIESDTEMPPGGWRMIVPATGVPVHAPYAKTLFKRVNAHLDANGQPPMERDAFEDLACRESGHGLPWCSGGPRPVKPPTTIAKVKRFLKSMLEVAKRRDFVSGEEYQRRIEICQACPLISIEGLGCHGCVSDLRAVERQLGALPDGNVETCSACGCLIALKARIGNASLDAAERSEPVAYHPACWRLQGD